MLASSKTLTICPKYLLTIIRISIAFKRKELMSITGVLLKTNFRPTNISFRKENHKYS